MLKESIELETLRQNIEDTEFTIGDKTDYLSYGKPNPSQAKETRELIERLKLQSKASRAELKQKLDTFRSEKPEVVQEWINYHLDLLQNILNEQSTDKNAPARKLVTKQTMEQWEKVRAGEMEYVNINWNFLKDYKAQVRSIAGNSKSAVLNQDKPKEKSKWQFWK